MKQKVVFWFSFSLLVGLYGIIFRHWFLSPDIIGGDWIYVFAETVKASPLFSSSWNAGYGNGLGGTVTAYFLDVYVTLAMWMSRFLNVPWPYVVKLLWFGCVGLSAWGAWRLFQRLSPSVSAIAPGVAALIYSINTYALMLAGGGQFGVFAAYCVAPFVVEAYVRLFQHFQEDNTTQAFGKNVLTAGLLLGFVLSLDPRIGYVTAFVLAGLFIFIARNVRNWRRVLIALLGSAGIALLYNSYWLLPVLSGSAATLEQLGGAYTSVDSLRFFSFADFSHALSFLHPNWPENLFGKTYFLQPEFLAIPLLAFASLLFIGDKTIRRTPQTNILFFALLGIIGAFLVKGANPPFGALYIWLFERIPGFIMFRDPTKWYVLVALSYAMLIPLALYELGKWISLRRPKQFPWYQLLLAAFLIFWLVAHKEAVLGKLGGTFAVREVPQEYVAWKDYLARDPSFSRTLWVPRQQRFTFTSKLHPSVEATPLFEATDAAQFARVFSEEKTKLLLEHLGVGYVAIPFDVYGEIFQEDRKYDPLKRRDIEILLDSVPWLEKFMSGNLTVYKTPFGGTRIYADSRREMEIVSLSPERMHITLGGQSANEIIFADSYHPGWVAIVNGQQIAAQKTEFDTMRFLVPVGTASIDFVFLPDRYYRLGRLVTIATLAFVGVALMVQSKNQKRKKI